MSKFKVGDKVRVLTDTSLYSGGIPRSLVLEYSKNVHTVTGLSSWGSVLFNGDIACLDGGDGFVWPDALLELVKNDTKREFIIVRREGPDVIAEHKRGGKIVKTAKAKCAPSDEFDFETGAKLAFDRLVGREETKPKPAAPEPKYYTGKVFAVRTKKFGYDPIISARVGHVFEIKNGVIQADYHKYGIMDGRCIPYKTFKAFCDEAYATEWAEVKE